jgi:hypothetical protein
MPHYDTAFMMHVDKTKPQRDKFRVLKSTLNWENTIGQIVPQDNTF